MPQPTVRPQRHRRPPRRRSRIASSAPERQVRCSAVNEGEGDESMPVAAGLGVVTSAFAQ